MVKNRFYIFLFSFAISKLSYGQIQDSVVVTKPDSIKDYMINKMVLNSNGYLGFPSCCSPDSLIIEISSAGSHKIIDSNIVYSPLAVKYTLRNGIKNGLIQLYCADQKSIAVEGFMDRGKEDGTFRFYEYYKGNKSIKLVQAYVTYKAGKLNGPRVYFFNYIDSRGNLIQTIAEISMYKNDKLISGFEIHNNGYSKKIKGKTH